MATFTINNDNNITVYASAAEAAQAGDATATPFESSTEFANATAAWPLSRLADIWNRIPGSTEVRRFAGRKKAVARIWQALQSLTDSAPQGEPKPLKRPKGIEPGGKTKKANLIRTKGKGARSNKRVEVIAMMMRSKGVTLAEIMETTGWQAHTVRGFVSLLGGTGGRKVESIKNVAGERTYRISK